MEKRRFSTFSQEAQKRLSEEVGAVQPIYSNKPYWQYMTYSYAERLKTVLTSETGFRRICSLVTLEIGTRLRFKIDGMHTDAFPLINKIVNQDLGNSPAPSIWDDRWQRWNDLSVPGQQYLLNFPNKAKF